MLNFHNNLVKLHCMDKTMEKVDFKKLHKDMFNPSAKEVSVLDIPEFGYICIDGKGNPNGEIFSISVEALYSVNYAIKMSYKKNLEPEGFYEYVVPPLEGIWTLEDEPNLKKINKDELIWTIMIMQPEFVNEEVFNKFLKIAMDKKENPFHNKLYYKKIKQGKCVQMMHIGSFDNETETFKVIEDYMDKNGIERKNYYHREIYLSDPRKTEQSKLKTILRYEVQR